MTKILFLIVFWGGVLWWMHTAAKGKKCPYCKSRYTTFIREEKDITSKYNRKLDVYKCNFCNKGFNRRYNDDWISFFKTSHKKNQD